MPTAAVAALGTFFASVGFSAAAAAFLAKAFVYVAAAYLLNRAAKALAPKSKSAGLGVGTEINYYDSGASVRICYGQVKTGGMETIPPMTTSKPNSNAFEDLHKVLTLAGHEIDSYNFTHFDTTTITNAQLGPMAFTMSDGIVSSGPFDQHAFIRHYRGTSTDSADRFLTQISSPRFGNARARGIAKAALTLRFNADVYKHVPTITFTFQGKRCYDPRLDASPGAAPTNPSFIVWTRNPALCLADYLMSALGGSYASTDIDWDTVVTAANYCDGSVNLPNATTQARYTCNGVLFATAEFTENVKALVDAMLGRVIFRDGKWRMYAGSWQTPTFTITKSDWISGLSIRFEQGRKKRFNQMRTWYVDSSREWQRMESIPRLNPTFRTADGEETIDAETEQLLCTNEFEAQRKGEFLLRQSRNQITVAGRLPPRFQNIALWDTGTIVFDHLGWSSKTFRAVGLDMNPDGSMDCVFAEEQSGDWTDLDAADYNQLSDAPLPEANATKPTEPPAFSATPQINGTIMFGWTRPIVQPEGTVFRIIRSTNSADASVGTVVWEGVANPVPLVMPHSPHWYYVQAVANSQFSPFQPNTFGIGAIARVEANNPQTTIRLVADAEFEFGSASSLWRPAEGNFLTYIHSPNAQLTYNANSGQFGGYMNLRMATNVATADLIGNTVRPAMWGVTLINTDGIAHNPEMFAFEVRLRVRVNSYPTAAQMHEEGLLYHTLTGSNHVVAVAGIVRSYQFLFGGGSVGSGYAFRGAQPDHAVAYLTDSMCPLGEWRSFTIREVKPHLGVTSAYAVRVSPMLYTIGAGNVDVDHFQTEIVGASNEFQTTLTKRNAGHTLREWDSMRQISCGSVSGSDNDILFSTNIVDPWWQWQTGRTFRVFKRTQTALFIEPRSGMNLYLLGRAAVGTITMVTSLQAEANIAKVSDNDFFVTGTGLI